MRHGPASSILPLLLFGLVAGCGSEDEPPGPHTAKLSPERVEQLRALGYVESASTAAEPSKSGAVTLDASAVSPGYSLYVAPFHCAAHLVDLDGTVVKSWQDRLSYDGARPACTKWQHAELLPDGDLLVPVSARARPGRQTGAHLLRLAWDGTVVWRRPLRAHHDAEQAPGGEILVLELAFRKDHPYEPEAALIDNAVLVLSPEGTLQRRYSLYDILRTNSIGFELRPRPAHGELALIDLLHANSVETLHDARLAERHPLYAPGNLLVSARHQDAVFILDPATRDLVWLFGPGELSGQHDAQMLPNGNVLIFDNGLDRGWSRVVEVDPVANEIVWQYGDGGEQAFFTPGRGASQKLANGNVLIANSNEGEAFEVTPDGRVVWRFYHPEIDDEGRREVIVRMLRYPPERIEPLLAAEGTGP